MVKNLAMVKDEVAKEYHFNDWKSLENRKHITTEIVDKVAERYHNSNVNYLLHDVINKTEKVKVEVTDAYLVESSINTGIDRALDILNNTQIEFNI